VEELCPDQITFVKLEIWRSRQIQWGIFKKLPMLKAFMETEIDRYDPPPSLSTADRIGENS